AHARREEPHAPADHPGPAVRRRGRRRGHAPWRAAARGRARAGVGGDRRVRRACRAGAPLQRPHHLDLPGRWWLEDARGRRQGPGGRAGRVPHHRRRRGYRVLNGGTGMALSMLAAAMDAVAQAGAAAPDPVAWTPQHWDALGNVLLGVGAVVGGAFGLYTYRKATRTREAEWLDRLFERFYLNPTFSPLLLSFEYEFVAGTNRLVDRVLTVDTPVLAPAEIERIRSVDVVLNFLEHLLYLESDRHLLARDRDALFGYWLGLLSRPRYASL